MSRTRIVHTSPGKVLKIPKTLQIHFGRLDCTQPQRESSGFLLPHITTARPDSSGIGNVRAFRLLVDRSMGPLYGTCRKKPYVSVVGLSSGSRSFAWPVTASNSLRPYCLQLERHDPVKPGWGLGHGSFGTAGQMPRAYSRGWLSRPCV